jgi:hypothetical protein
MPRGIPGSSPTEAHARAAAAQKRWRDANPEKARAYSRRYGGRYRRYGVTPEEWHALLRESDGLCASCYEEPATHLDHDHATGETRGSLCSSCNQGLGNFKDDPEKLQLAIAYLGGE